MTNNNCKICGTEFFVYTVAVAPNYEAGIGEIVGDKSKRKYTKNNNMTKAYCSKCNKDVIIQ